MARPKLPEELKKKQITVTFPAKMYDFLKTLPNASEFLEMLVEPHMPTSKKRKTI